jgi:protocatechuate 3,4-dioxygenase beta subunit
MSDRMFIENRRQFLKRASIFAVVPVLPVGLSSLCGYSEGTRVTEQRECEWCGAADAPARLSWRTAIAPAGEPGEPLLISGTVYRPDGKTPAKGLLLYVYHTDARGYYRTSPTEHRHGRLRGWMRTNNEGRYEFSTIRPAPYPEMNEPAHIHITVSGTDTPEYWIDSFWFEGDPLITTEKRARLSGRGGFSPIIALKRDENSLWRGSRDIRTESRGQRR